MNIPSSQTSSAFTAQAWVAFAVSLGFVTVGIFYLPIDPWIRGYLAVSSLFLVSSAFTLAKVVRDAQEGASVVNRVDAARVEKLLTERDTKAA